MQPQCGCDDGQPQAIPDTPPQVVTHDHAVTRMKMYGNHA